MGFGQVGFALGTISLCSRRRKRLELVACCCGEKADEQWARVGCSCRVTPLIRTITATPTTDTETRIVVESILRPTIDDLLYGFTIWI